MKENSNPICWDLKPTWALQQVQPAHHLCKPMFQSSVFCLSFTLHKPTNTKYHCYGLLAIQEVQAIKSPSTVELEGSIAAGKKFNYL